MQNRVYRTILAVLSMVSILALSTANASAAVTATAPVTTNVSSDTAVLGSVALPSLTLSEGSAGEIPVGTITFALPSGYVFDTSSVANVTATGTSLAVASAVSFNDSTHVSINVTASSTSSGSVTIGSVTPLKVKASSGTPLAGSANIIISAGTLTGLATSTSFGTLVQVPGTASQLSFTIQPPSSLTVGTTFSASVSVKDQFGNVVTSDNGRTINISVVPISSTTTTGTLSGILSLNDVSGVSSFTGLSFNKSGTIALAASSTGLNSVNSTNIILSAVVPTTTPPTSTPPSRLCNLHNGILVKVAGSPTVYMVVNCVLRPFNTPAVFHAKGKKFQDIVTISNLNLAIGRPVGEGNDDDDTIIIPPTSTTTPTSTLPNLANLPNGTLVKLAGNPTIYMVSGGVLQPFTSGAVFNAHKKSFKNVKTISDSQFSSLTVGSPVTFPDGTLVKGSGGTIYVISGGMKLGIPSLDSMKKHGQSLKNVLKISEGELNVITSGGNQD